MLKATVFVFVKDRLDIPPVKLPPCVTGDSLLTAVRNKPGFGEGTVQDQDGTTLVQETTNVPDGEYVFIPSHAGKT